jgi:hypothetical protein
MATAHANRAAPILAASLLAAAAAALPALAAEPKVVSGAGNVAVLLEEYRAALGGQNNGNAPGPLKYGRREINWDGIPDAKAAPAFLPSDQFRARGAILTTPGEGVQASAAPGNAAGVAPRFGNINEAYASTFRPFSAERLFSPVGSNAVDLTFVIPGSERPATVRGFGAVYVDVDQEHTAFEYFDRNDKSLGRFAVPIANGGFSFLGVVFDQPVVARVRIEYGTVQLGPEDGPDNDVAVMDDFIYGEPRPIRK